MTVRVFILDDHELMRRGLREFIDDEDGIEVVGEAATAAEGLEEIARLEPDVAIVDVRLPDGNGVEVCRDVSDLHPGVRCLILTSFADEQPMIDALMSGAAGYLLKDARGAEIVDAIRAIAAGTSTLDPSVAETVLERLRGADSRPDLTDQEWKVLDLIGRGMTNRAIADELHLAEQTVKNYVSTLLSKLGMSRRTQAAVYVTQLKSEGRFRS